MAVSVDTVYKTVLLVLNKEQRGLVTPDEFNKTATQVQLDIFEQYFEDLNQQFRAPQATVDYSNRQYSLEEKISIFKTEGNCVYSAGKFNLPIVDASGNTVIYDGTDPVVSTQVAFYKLGTVIYTPPVGYSIELEKVLKHDFYNLLKSDLTAPSENFPIYLYEGKTSTGIKTITVTTGEYEVNLTNAMSDTNFATLNAAATGSPLDSNTYNRAMESVGRAVNILDCITYAPNNTAIVDIPYIQISAHGDLA